jgi:uncharacterized Rmd1/YagE family protein
MSGPAAMRSVSVHAYGIASTLRPRDAAGWIGGAGDAADGASKITKTLALLHQGGDRYTVIYDFGAVVFFFDVPQRERELAMTQLLARCGPEPRAPFVDDFLVEVRPEAPGRSEVTFDRATVRELDAPTVELVSLVLAQSVGMDYYEDDVDGLFKRVGELSSALEAKGRLRGPARVLNRFVGSILTTRNQILTTLSLLDAPPITWEREASDRLYRELRGAFEIEDRHTALELKLKLIQENLEIIVDLAQHRRALQLEVTVVVLILVEVAIGVFEILRSL